MAEKRRTVSRKKTQAPASRAPVKFKHNVWLRELVAACIVVVALVLAISIGSRGLGLGVENQTGAIRNAMGPAGHIVGTIFFGILGWSALVPALMLALLGVASWKGRWSGDKEQRHSIAAVVTGLVGVVFFASVLAASFWGKVGGGDFGSFIAQPLKRLFGAWGACLIAVSLGVCSLALASRLTVGTVIKTGGLIGKQASHRLIWQLPIMIWRTAVFVLESFLGFLGGRLRIAREIVYGPALPPAQQEFPRPRLRRNKIEPAAEDSSEEILSAPSAKDDYSRVVVRRGGLERSGRKGRKSELDGPIREVDVGPEQPYIAPDLSLLTRGEAAVEGENDEELRSRSRLIEEKLRDFGIEGRVTQVHPGPVITLYEFEPAAGVKVGRIAALADDLSMTLRASSLRIVAPIPRRGTVGIELPNKQREVVRLRDLLESDVFRNAESILTVPLGKDTYGEPVVVDVSTMPHVLMAGATGTGKSVCINAMLLSLLYRATPKELGLILIDPKILELSVYEGIPHLRVPVVTVPKQARAVLQWATKEMDRRYRLMQRFGVRSIDGYNRMIDGEEEGTPGYRKLDENVIMLRDEEVVEEGAVHEEREQSTPISNEKLEHLPKIVIVIDELADLMLTVGRDIEDLITRLAQKARAAGIHLILATQRPSVDVITGLIKANFPARISFQVTTRVDSRTILDSMGAEKLLGKGDMLLMSPGAFGLRRIHGAFVSDAEVKKVIQALKKNSLPQYDAQIMDLCEKALVEDKASGEGGEEEEYDSFYDKAVELVVEKGQASTSMIQRVFRIGYNRAARIVEQMEREGVVGPMDGAKAREVLAPARSRE